MVVEPSKAKNGIWWQIILLYILLTLLDFAHMFAQYSAVSRVGSVAMGIAKAISSVVVFVLSDLCFCSSDQGQCINSWKTISLCIVLTGVIAYSVGTALKGKCSKSKKENIETSENKALIDNIESTVDNSS